MRGEEGRRVPVVGAIVLVIPSDFLSSSVFLSNPRILRPLAKSPVGSSTATLSSCWRLDVGFSTVLILHVWVVGSYSCLNPVFKVSLSK